MLIALALSLAAAATPVDRFARDLPDAHRIPSADGQRLVHASGFFARTGLRVPEDSARAFLLAHGAAFGLTARQALVLEGAPPKGNAGAVHFARTLDDLPVFGGDLVVGVDAEGRVFLVNGGDVPPDVSGSHLLGDAAAERAALSSFAGGVQGAGPATVAAGWRTFGPFVRAVYRVDFISQKPAGDFRVFVDGETGAMLFREDLRRYASAEGRVFEISPSETADSLCGLSGTPPAHLPCAIPVMVTIPNLATGTDLTGTQTSAFNCKGQNAPTSAASVPGTCSPITANSDGTFDFTADPTFIDPTDDFSAVMAYFHLDKHVSFFKKLDPTVPPARGGRAIRGSLPALVNVLAGGQPFENAFFSGRLDAMVFGQGAGSDFAYDATVMYHEFTHGVVAAWGDFDIGFDSLGGVDEPGAVNEGTADAMAAAETGRSELGAFLAATDPTGPGPFVRDMNDPDATRSCQGNGTITNELGAPGAINGLDGEVHDDGEIWTGLFWETFQGLKTAGVKACSGACEAGPALQYKALQLSGGTFPLLNSYWLTMKSAASALFPGNPEVATYVECVGKRRGFDKCDQTFPVYAGESKAQFIRLRYSTFQMVLTATAPSAQFDICSVKGNASTVHLRKNLPVALSAFTQNGAATVTDDVRLSIAQPCKTAGKTTLTLPSAGTWFVLIESPDALIGANPGFDIYLLTAASTGIAARPPSTTPPICSLPSSLSIDSPVSSVAPRGKLSLAASGGSGGGYGWSFATNASGGSIDGSSGAYAAGSTGSVSDVVQVVDSAGKARTRSISVTEGVVVSPGTSQVAPKGTVPFFAGGGSGSGFVWSLATNASGGTIDASTGAYTAGQTGNVTDLVRATDSLGNAGTASVSISAAPSGGCTSAGGEELSALAVAVAALLRRRKRQVA